MFNLSNTDSCYVDDRFSFFLNTNTGGFKLYCSLRNQHNTFSFEELINAIIFDNEVSTTNPSLNINLHYQAVYNINQYLCKVGWFLELKPSNSVFCSMIENVALVGCAVDL